MIIDPQVVITALSSRLGGLVHNRLPNRDEQKLVARLEVLLINVSNLEFYDDDCIEFDDDAEQYKDEETEDEWAPDEIENTANPSNGWIIGGRNLTVNQILDAWDYYTYGRPDRTDRRSLDSLKSRYRLDFNLLDISITVFLDLSIINRLWIDFDCLLHVFNSQKKLVNK